MFNPMGSTNPQDLGNGGTIDGDLVITGDLQVSGGGSLSFDEIITGNSNITGTLTIGSDGSGSDVTFYSATAGDSFFWDASEEKLTITGTNGQVALAIADGNVTIADDLDVDGTLNVDAIDIDGALQLDSTLTVGTDGSGQDVTFYSGTAGDSFVWDSSEEKLTITGTNGQTALDIADGNLVVADNVDIEGDIDVNGTTNLDDVDIDGDVDISGSITNAAWTGDVIASAYLDSDTAHLSGTQTFSGAKSFSDVVDITNTTDSSDATGDTGALRVEGGISVAKKLYVGTDLDVDGTANLDAVDIDGNVQLDGTLTVGTDGSGQDVIFYSGTSGDNFTWDSSEEKLTITGTSGAVALDVHTGKITFGDAGTTYGTLNQNSLYFSNATGIVGTSTDHDLRLNTNSTIRMILDSNSKVCISNNDGGNVGNTLFGKSIWDNSSDNGADYNTLFGEGCMNDGSVSGASHNTGVGYNALKALRTGDNNTAFGSKALDGIIGGDYNTAVGFQACQGFGINELGNTAVGANAMTNMDEGDGNCNYNVAVGLEAFVGADEGGGTDDKIGNIAVGAYALDATAAEAHTGVVAIGHQALTDLTTGVNNVAIGYQSQQENITGSRNISLGYQALERATASDDNIAIGFQALNDTGLSNADSDRNIAIGSYALDAIDGSESDNIGIGFGSLGSMNNSSSVKNVAIGNYTLDAVTSDAQTGLVAVGHQALTDLTSGTQNTAVGYQSGNLLTTGGNNTIIGYDADASDNSASNQTVIGQGATGQADNSVTLGNASVTAVYMAQDSGAVVYASGVNFPDSHSASGDANTLDDYQEGTWTPVLAMDSTDLSNQDGTTVATYTKIGRMVWFEFSYVFDGGETIASGTHLTLRGFPETPSIGNFHNIGNGQAYNMNVARYPITGYWITDRIYLYRMDTTDRVFNSSPFAWGNEDYLTFRGFYKV